MEIIPEGNGQYNWDKKKLTNIDTIADNIAGNNADNKVDIYNIARNCRLDPHTGIRLNPERASNLTFTAGPEPTCLLA